LPQVWRLYSKLFLLSFCFEAWYKNYTMVLREFQEKKIARRLIFSAPVLVVVLALSFWMIYGVVSAFVTLRELSGKNQKLSQDLEEIKKSRKVVEEKVNIMDTEYDIDFEARKNFNLKKPGEEVILFVEE